MHQHSEDTHELRDGAISLRCGVACWLLALLVLLSLFEWAPGGLLPCALYPAFLAASGAIFYGKKSLRHSVESVGDAPEVEEIINARRGLRLGWNWWIFCGAPIVLWMVCVWTIFEID